MLIIKSKPAGTGKMISPEYARLKEQHVLRYLIRHASNFVSEVCGDLPQEAALFDRPPECQYDSTASDR
jgi:hypothetical protein